MMRPRLLWISHFVPYPPKGGAFQRSFNLVKQVSEHCDVDLFAIRHKRQTHPDVTDEDAARALGHYCRRVYIVPLPAVQSRVRLAGRLTASLLSGRSLTTGLYDVGSIRRAAAKFAEHGDYDVLHMDSVSVAPLRDCLAGSIPWVLNHHGAEGWMMQRRVARERSLPKRLFFCLEARLLMREERRYCAAAASNTVCSAFDAGLLQELAPNGHYEVVANGVDTEFFRIERKPAHPPRVIFAGRLDQYSNRDGIVWFCREVWPLIRRSMPEVRLDILGANPPQALRELAAVDPRVAVHGFVDDIRPYFAAASVAVTPIRDGGGTRIKVLDAMSMCIPVVATSVALEGLDVVPGEELLTADSAQAYGEAVISLIRDQSLCARLAEAARTRVEVSYSWPSIGRELVNVYRRLAGAPTTSSVGSTYIANQQ